MVPAFCQPSFSGLQFFKKRLSIPPMGPGRSSKWLLRVRTVTIRFYHYSKITSLQAQYVNRLTTTALITYETEKQLLKSMHKLFILISWRNYGKTDSTSAITIAGPGPLVWDMIIIIVDNVIGLRKINVLRYFGGDRV